MASENHKRVGEILQEGLVDLAALSLNGKQAHWHVRGPRFTPVHEQLDLIVDDVRTWGDEVAERSITLGVPVDGRPATVAGETAVEALPTGYIDDAKAVALVRDRIDIAVNRLRAHIDELGDLDPVTQDLVIGIVAGLEKHRWMLEAQST